MAFGHIDHIEDVGGNMKKKFRQSGSHFYSQTVY